MFWEAFVIRKFVVEGTNHAGGLGPPLLRIVPKLHTRLTPVFNGTFY